MTVVCDGDSEATIEVETTKRLLIGAVLLQRRVAGDPWQYRCLAGVPGRERVLGVLADGHVLQPAPSHDLRDRSRRPRTASSGREVCTSRSHQDIWADSRVVAAHSKDSASRFQRSAGPLVR